MHSVRLLTETLRQFRPDGILQNGFDGCSLGKGLEAGKSRVEFICDAQAEVQRMVAAKFRGVFR